MHPLLSRLCSQMLADARPTALLATSSSVVVLADARPATLLAVGRRMLPWSYVPLASLGELVSRSLNRLSVCLSCLF